MRTTANAAERVLRLVVAIPIAPMRWAGRLIGRIFARGNRELALKIDSLQQRVAGAEQATAAIDRAVHEALELLGGLRAERTASDAPESPRLPQGSWMGALEQVIAGELQPVAAGLAAQLAQDRQGVADALHTLRLQQEELRAELAATHQTVQTVSSPLSEVYGTPPTLRRIPGWHTYWGIDEQSNRFIQGRAELWKSLARPVLMRWLADLVVMIWPGNELSRVLFLTGNFEPNELTWLSETLTEGMTMIDVGAHMGMYTLAASKLVGASGMVVALEPSTREFQRLTFHVTLNDRRNVRSLALAASDSAGDATLKIAEEWNSGHNTLGSFFNPDVALIREERIQRLPLDEVVARQGLNRVDVIKIDAEGHELQVLAGAVGTLARFRPVILIEVFGAALRGQGGSVDAILAFFAAHGYAVNEFSDASGELTPLARQLGDESRNLVARPCEPR
jgi:FkbM family methyltransferase